MRTAFLFTLSGLVLVPNLAYGQPREIIRITWSATSSGGGQVTKPDGSVQSWEISVRFAGAFEFAKDDLLLQRSTASGSLLSTIGATGLTVSCPGFTDVNGVFHPPYNAHFSWSARNSFTAHEIIDTMPPNWFLGSLDVFERVDGTRYMNSPIDSWIGLPAAFHRSTSYTGNDCS